MESRQPMSSVQGSSGRSPRRNVSWEGYIIMGRISEEYTELNRSFYMEFGLAGLGYVIVRNGNKRRMESNTRAFIYYAKAFYNTLF